MARLSKGNFIGKIRQPMCGLVEARVRDGRNWIHLQIVRPSDIDAMLRQAQPRKAGRPEFVAMEGGQYLFTVYPIPDRRYDCELVGTVYVKQ